MNNKELSGFLKVIKELSNDNGILKESLENAYNLMSCGRYNDAMKVLKALKGVADVDIGTISFIDGKAFSSSGAILALIKDAAFNAKLLKRRESVENSLLTNGTIDTSHILEIKPDERVETLKKLDSELVRLAILHDNIVRNMKKAELATKYCITDFGISGILLNGQTGLTEETLRFPKQYENWITVEDFLNLSNVCNIDHSGIKVYSLETVTNTYLKGYTVEEIHNLSNLPLGDIIKHLENRGVYKKMSSSELSIFKLRAYFGVKADNDVKIMFETYSRAYKRYRMLLKLNANGLESKPFENRRIHWNYSKWSHKTDNERNGFRDSVGIPERMVSKV